MIIDSQEQRSICKGPGVGGYLPLVQEPSGLCDSKQCVQKRSEQDMWMERQGLWGHFKDLNLYSEWGGNLLNLLSRGVRILLAAG